MSPSSARLDAEFNPDRLRLARERRGFTKASLAQVCGVTRRAVSDWEAGKVDRPPLQRIAEALAFPAVFFIQDSYVELSEDEVSFRALTSMTARQARRVLAHSSIVRTLSDWIDARYETPASDVPSLQELVPPEQLSEPDPVAAASALRSLWNLGVTPIKDMMALVESHGVRVFALNGEDREVDAFSYWKAARPTVFLNVEKSSERLRFDLAHELGHLCMHKGVKTSGHRQYEIDANVFASNFLMPAEGLYAQVLGHPGLEDVFILKKYWRVSATAMVYRLNQLGLINDWQYRTWMVDLSRRGFRRSEPKGITREQSVLLGKIVELAREDKWTIARIARDLGLPISEITSALAGLTVVPIEGGSVGGLPAHGHLSVVI